MSVRGNRTHDLAHTGWMLSSRLCRPKPLSEYDMTCVLHVCLGQECRERPVRWQSSSRWYCRSKEFIRKIGTFEREH